MTTIVIEDNSPQARQLLEFIKTLPYATVLEEKSCCRKAVEECDTITVDAFFDELDDRIREHFKHA